MDKKNGFTLVFSILFLFAAYGRAQTKKLMNPTQAHDELQQKLKDPNALEIELSGIQGIWVRNIYGELCAIGAFEGTGNGYSNVRFTRKVENKEITWILKNEKGNPSSSSCKNGMEFKANKEGQFISVHVSKTMTETLSEYAKHSCTIGNKGMLYQQRELSEEESNQVAKCFMDENNQYWDYEKKYKDESFENGFVRGKGIALHCGKYLFDSETYPRRLHCDNDFLKMATLAKVSVVGSSANELCTRKMKEFELNKYPNLICPLDVRVQLSPAKFSTVFYGKGDCSNGNEGRCVHLQKKLLPALNKLMKESNSPSKSGEAVN